jgi:hypothetical protein
MKGIDPLAFRMQSGRSTTELHPHPWRHPQNILTLKKIIHID